ncbi:MAG: hypothetical protein B7Z15_08490 [Rhizobiales bacterium 32-66-8]|nr:MAG: hypothetical protein B7Z15_08490 [Rhizobiales bacterium 32-66-8]
MRHVVRRGAGPRGGWMVRAQFSPWTGEFTDPAREHSYRIDRLPDQIRSTRNMFLLGALVTLGFIVSDLRFLETPHFANAAVIRASVILVCLVSAAATRRITSPWGLSLLFSGWSSAAVLSVVLMMLSRTDQAVFAIILLPAVLYLATPPSLKLAILTGAGGSIILTSSFLMVRTNGLPVLEVALGIAFFNIVLSFTAWRIDHHARLQWAAAREAHEARDVVLQSQRLLEQTFMAVPLPLLITDIETGRILRFNEAGVHYFGGPPEDFGITTVMQIYSDTNSRRGFLDQLARNGRVTNFETKIRLGHGEVRSVLLASAFTEVDGRPCLISAVMDITDRLQAEQKVRHAATHDPLTGLSNRAAFQAHLEAAIRRSSAATGMVVLLLVDLDALKDVNDTLGHDAGDALLVETARRLERLGGEIGTVARLGGDEFVVLLPRQAATQAARALGEAILRDFRQPLAYGERHLTTKASIGIAACPSADYAPGELMKDADLALYSAKQQGRNRVVLYHPDMRRTINERITVHRDLVDAVSHRTIFPYYQPKISLTSGRLTGLEALMRWQERPGVIRTPDHFMTAFDDPELAALTGDLMLRQIARDARDWCAAGHDFGRIAFNLAPAQLANPDLAAHLLAILAEEGVDPRLFDVEVTETVFLGRNSERVAAVLDELYAAGMRVALDDFGTGYAALIHLKQLPIDAVKIDRSFVADIQTDTFDAAIVCAVIELGRNLGLRVIAEGVETTGHARFLRARGCEYAQGYLYARPMPATDLLAFLDGETESKAAARVQALSD